MNPDVQALVLSLFRGETKKMPCRCRGRRDVRELEEPRIGPGTFCLIGGTVDYPVRCLMECNRCRDRQTLSSLIAIEIDPSAN